jgi:hypothetical protein
MVAVACGIAAKTLAVLFEFTFSYVKLAVMAN